jgi:hypothetical protein
MGIIIENQPLCAGDTGVRRGLHPPTWRGYFLPFFLKVEKKFGNQLCYTLPLTYEKAEQ